MLEVIIAVFIFSIIVAGTSSLFIRSIKNQQTIQELRKDYDKASVALNEMSKVIVTSKLSTGQHAVSNMNAKRLFFYSVSQNMCMEYRFDDNAQKIWLREAPISAGGGGKEEDFCDDAYLDANTGGNDIYQEIADVSVLGRFRIEPELGRAASVTVFMEVNPGLPGSRQNMFLQTTVALRKSIAEY